MDGGSAWRWGEAPLAIVEIDADAVVTGWSGRAARMFGVEAGDAIGRPVAEVLPVDGGEAAWRTLLVDDDAALQWRHGGADGPRTVEWLRQLARDDAGAVVGVRCLGRDVTAQAAERARRELDAQALQAVVDNLTLSTWTVDEAGRLVHMRRRAGTPGPELGDNIFTLYPDPAANELLRRSIAGEPKFVATEDGDASYASWMIPVEHARPDEAAVVGVSFDVSDLKRGERALRDKLELIERQQRVIRELGTPIIEVWDGVLTLPIIGLVDSVRTAEIMDNLLQSVTRVRARYAILDMTGVEVVDTGTASHLLGLIKAVRLLGAEGIITGIHPGIAQTIVALGIDLGGITVHANLREALKDCIGRMQAGPRRAAPRR